MHSRQRSTGGGPEAVTIYDLIEDVAEAILRSPLNFRVKKSKHRKREEEIRDKWAQEWRGDTYASNHHDRFGG